MHYSAQMDNGPSPSLAVTGPGTKSISLRTERRPPTPEEK